MAIYLEELTIDVTLGTSSAIIAVAGAASSVFITSAVFTNSGAVNETVTIWRLKDGVVASATNYLAKIDIPPTKTWICNELIGSVIKNASAIHASTTTATAVNANISATVKT